MANGIVLNIDTTKSEFQNPMIELRQGDGNYQSLDVTVTSNGSPFNLTGWTITFMGTTAGGFKIVDTLVSNVDTTNGKFTYTPTKAWGQDEGMFKEAYFKFTSGANGNSVASGASLRVNVLTAVDLTVEEAGNYISIVDQTIGKLTSDLSTLQTSVDQLKAQNNAIKTTDNTWTGTNTFNKKIIAPAGVQGPIDNTSLINAPAFQSLQNKVVGTNLLIGTATPASITGNNSGNQTKNTYYIANGMSAYTLYQKYGSTFTLSYDWSVTDTASAYTGQMQQQFTWNPWGFSDITTISSSNTSGHKVTTFTISNSSTNTANGLAFRLANVPTTSTITVSNMKLEKGNVATDWCPAPEDVPSNDAQLVHKTGTETVAGDKAFTGNNTFTQNISGNITGNSATTTKLQTPRKINGTNFDGTADINVNAANDSNLVHRTGNETVAGDKTFTGNITAPQVIANDLLTGFHNVIQVPTTTTKIIDLINNDFIKGKDFWKEQTFIAYNSTFSDSPTNDLYSIIKLATRGSARTYVEYSDLSGSVWHTTATVNTLNPWVKQANDTEVIHNTGTETVAGNKTFTGSTTFSNNTTIKNGNYGLRVTSTGVQKTSDGGTTWTNI